MDLAIDIVKGDKVIREETKQVLKEYNEQSLQSQAKKGAQLTAMMPAIKRAFELVRDDNYELVVENNVLRDKIGDVNEEWLETSKKKLLENTGNDEKNKVFLERIKRQQMKLSQLTK
jgi:hypothetical protein